MSEGRFTLTDQDDPLAPSVPDRDRGPRFSFAGKLAVGLLGILVIMAGVAAAAVRLPLNPWGVFLVTLLIGWPLGLWLVSRLTRPLRHVLGGLSDGIQSFRDRDFSVRLASGRRDELGDLARLYNRVGETLLDERKRVREREVLLQTTLDQSPAAIVLVNQVDRVIYANREARRLLTGGARLEGRSFGELQAACPEEMREILASETDGVFNVQSGERAETYHLSQRRFRLNRQRHRLIQLRRLTGDLGRREAEVWKRVIRVISHELKNSLAPVSSLIHSARILSVEGEDRQRADRVWSSLRERLDDLSGFIDGYARFARLPQPRRRSVDWEELVGGLEEFPDLRLVGRLPAEPGHFDPAQVRQLLINLVKNAYEASDGEPDVRLRVKAAGDGTYLQVMDRGRGMDEETMRNALLPFYSTKKRGTGLGLPLCREILEAHGGKLSIQARERGGTLVTCWLPSE